MKRIIYLLTFFVALSLLFSCSKDNSGSDNAFVGMWESKNGGYREFLADGTGVNYDEGKNKISEFWYTYNKYAKTLTYCWMGRYESKETTFIVAEISKNHFYMYAATDPGNVWDCTRVK